MPISFTGALFPNEMIRTGVRWYMAAPWSTRNLGEMMLERHFRVDHSTMNRWVIKYSPQLEAKFHINTNHMSRTARPIGKTTIGGRTS
jgi:putative transposase